MFISQSSIATEYFCLVLCVMLLVLMTSTRPRVTSVFIIDFVGTIISIVAIVVDNFVVSFSDHYYGTEFYNLYVVKILIWAFLILYFVILVFIFSYVNRLALNRRRRTNEQEKMYLIYGLIYFTIAAFLFARGYMVKDLGFRLDINGYISFYTCAGMSCALAVIIEAIYNRKNISNRVFAEIIVFTPIDFAVLILQFIFRESIFMSTTYVAPFLLFYILFHSNPFDELTGCQNSYAFDSMMNLMIKKKKSYVLIEIDFPQLAKSYSQSMYGNHLQYVSDFVKEIEKYDRKIKLYYVSPGKFMVLRQFGSRDDLKIQMLYSKMTSILEKATNLGTHVTYGKLVGFKSFWFLKNEMDVQSYLDFVNNKLSNSKETEYFLATEQTQQDYIEEQEIAFALENIVYQNDLEDPRVLCYAQPIYDVNAQTFKSAEALMRLKIDGKLIAPNKFIPVAENKGYIHTMTCIMLNKVCKNVKYLSDNYDFDVITINCSPKEFSDTNLYQDIIKIMDSYDIDKSKVSLELTESAMFENYDAVKYNMQRLEEAGIRFYLDDFGTGYSNIERVTSCNFKTVKFDKSLLYKALSNKVTDDLVTSMIEMLKRFGVRTLVEGVEDEEQSEYSIDKGFDYMQGFKYARPEPIENLKNYFSTK